MKTRSIGALIVGLVSVLALGGNPAGAGTAMGPEIVDPAGDGNWINGHDFFLGFEEGPDTRPASIDGADLRAIWFETAYDTVKDTDASGSVTAVRYVAKALRVNIRTEGPPMPTFGPTLTFRVPAKIGACRFEFDGTVAGPASTPEDEPQGPMIWKAVSVCPGGNSGANAFIYNPAFTLTSQGNVLTMTYPFSALPYSSKQLVLATDVEIKPPGDFNPAVQPWWTWFFGPIFIDETVQLSTKFRIGSDVPADVDCLTTPTHAECTA